MNKTAQDLQNLINTLAMQISALESQLAYVKGEIERKDIPEGLKNDWITERDRIIGVINQKVIEGETASRLLDAYDDPANNV